MADSLNYAAASRVKEPNAMAIVAVTGIHGRRPTHQTTTRRGQIQEMPAEPKTLIDTTIRLTDRPS